MDATIPEATTVLVDAVRRGDAAAAGSAYATDAKLLAPAPELVQGCAEIEAYWRAGIAIGLSAITFESDVLQRIEAGIVEAGRYAVYVDDAGGRTVAERGTYLVLHKQAPDGSWRRAVDVFDPHEPTTDPPDRREEER